MRRSRGLLFGAVVAVLLLTGCAAEDPGPAGAPAGESGPASPTAAAQEYGKSEMEAAALSLDDPSLAGFHPFTFPEPNPNDPAETDPCAVKWGDRFDGNGETATFDTDQVTFAENDNVGPFVF